MRKCPTVHEHPEFVTSYDSQNVQQQKIVQKLKRYLTSDNGHFIGEQLKYEFAPFKSFPRKRNPIRCLFILCKDCKQEMIDPKCGFCQSEIFSIRENRPECLFE